MNNDAGGASASNDGLGRDNRAALAEQLACVRQALPEELRESVPSVAVATLVAELELLRTALRRITHFTSATPSLSESGCGRLLAQIEHEATKALEDLTWELNRRVAVGSNRGLAGPFRREQE